MIQEMVQNTDQAPSMYYDCLDSVAEVSFGQQVNESITSNLTGKMSMMGQFIEKDRNGLLDKGEMTTEELRQALAELKKVDAAKDIALEKAKTRYTELRNHKLRGEGDLKVLEMQRREAINTYRPIKKEYVHNYRMSCIQSRQGLQKLQSEHDLIKKILNFTLVKVHT